MTYLSKLREDYLPLFNRDKEQDISFDKLKFITGENYTCAIDLVTEKILNVDDNFVEIHNLRETPSRLRDLINLVHLEDLPFLNFAENWGFQKMLDLKDFNRYKIGYLVRMRTTADHYDIFYHQTYYIKSLISNEIINCIHFNSNYKDIVKTMKYKISLLEVDTNQLVSQISYSKEVNPIIENLTGREIEIIKLIAIGLKDKEIAEKLYISFHTVRTHRKNILKKTFTTNSAELIKKSIVLGLI